MAATLALSGCGGEKKKTSDGHPTTTPAPSSQPATPGKQSVPLSLADGKARLELKGLSRTTATTVTGRFAVVNEGNTSVQLKGVLGDLVNDADAGYVLSLSGMGLLDAKNEKLYMPFHKGYKCLCSEVPSEIAPGATEEMFAVFPAPPADVQRVTLTSPGAPPFLNVPIGTGPVQPVPGQTEDASTPPSGKPRILPVLVTATGTEQGVDDKEGQRAINLQSDVLFAVNKAELTPRADGLLRQVAQQIDASRGTAVKVDGHADNTGNDAINQPLSERRAQTVAQRLKGLVTRQGVAFQAAGHGSSRPIADNGSDEGRRRNRRVTVTFPKPPEPAPAPGSASGRQPADFAPTTAVGSGEIAYSDGLRYEINGIHRTGDGLLLLVWTIRNAGTTVHNSINFDRSYVMYGTSAAWTGASTRGVMLEDPAAKMRYWPLETPVGHCECSLFVSSMRSTLRPGESVTAWNLYKAPADISTFDVSIPSDTRLGAVARGIRVQ
ncbi:OmpA family protein [Spirillospora sp. NPDC049652]